MLRHFLGDQYNWEMTKALLILEGRTDSCTPRQVWVGEGLGGQTPIQYKSPPVLSDEKCARAQTKSAAKDEAQQKEIKAISMPIKCYPGHVLSPLSQWEAELSAVEFFWFCFLETE